MMGTIISTVPASLTTHAHRFHQSLRGLFTASFCPMLSTTNDQRMGELELLLTPNQLGVTAPAGREPVLTSACQHATKSIHLHGM